MFLFLPSTDHSFTVDVKPDGLLNVVGQDHGLGACIVATTEAAVAARQVNDLSICVTLVECIIAAEHEKLGQVWS